MKDLVKKGSDRGRSFLISVSRALSPSRERNKSPSSSQPHSDKLSKKSTSKKDKVVHKSGNPSKNKRETHSKHKTTVKLGKLPSSSSDNDSKIDVVEEKMKTNKHLSDERSSSGASSQSSGGSTPTKSPIIVEYVHDKPSTAKELPSQTSYNEDVIYESRKLLFRKMVELEMKEAANKSDAKDDISVTDSWDDLEQNFSKVYERVPSVLTDNCSPLDKERLLMQFSTSVMRAEIAKMSDEELMYNLTFAQQASSKKGKFQNNSLTDLKDSGFSGNTEQVKVHAEIHRNPSDSGSESSPEKESDESPFGETDYETRAELYRNIRNLRSSLLRRQKLKARVPDDRDSWKSEPTDDEAIYVSRSEILSRHELTPLPSKSVISSLSQNKRRGPMKAISRSEILSRLEGVHELPDNNYHLGPPSEDSSDHTSQDSWSIGEHEAIYERRHRLPHAQRYTVGEGYDGSESEYSAEDELTNEESKRRLRLAGGAELQRRVMAILATQQHIAPATKTRVMDIINKHIQENASISMDYEEFQKRNEEIRNKLKEALAHDWETLSNVNLGLIYVPMEENGSISSKRSGTASRDVSDYDTLGSLDSLIFEPKVPSDQDIPEQSEEGSSMSDSSQLSVSLGVLPQERSTATEGAVMGGMNKVKNIVNSFDDLNGDKNSRIKTSKSKAKDRVQNSTTRNNLMKNDNNGAVTVDETGLNNCEFQGDLGRRRRPKGKESNGASGTSPNNNNVKPGVRGEESRGSPVLSRPDPHKNLVQQQEHEEETGASKRDDRKSNNIRCSSSVGVKDQLHNRSSATVSSSAGNNTRTPSRRSDNLPDEKSSNKFVHSNKDESPPLPPKVPLKKFFSSFKPMSFMNRSTQNNSASDRLANNGSQDRVNKATPIASFKSSECTGTSSHSVGDAFIPIDSSANDDCDDAESLSSNGRHPSDSQLGYEPHYEEARIVSSLDSESDSITSIESVIYRGANIDRDSTEVSENKYDCITKNVNRRDKYVVNHGHDSDTSDFDKSVSLGTSANMDSDTSWDYIQTKLPAPVGRHDSSECRISTVSDDTSDPFGPRVIGNLRRKKSNNTQETVPVPSPIEQFFNELKRKENETNLDNLNDDKDEDGIPQVMLLKHHIYQSIDSLISQKDKDEGAFGNKSDERCPARIPSTSSESCGELQMYGSRHGEPLYGARNALVFQSMNGAYVSREVPVTEQPPVIFRNGKIVEITEEMFRAPSQNQEDPSELKCNAEMNSSSDASEQCDFSHPCECEGRADGQETEDCEVSADSLKGESEPEEGKVQTLTNTFNSKEKIKRVQKVGVSILGNENNDLMIKELKLKLRKKFSADDALENCNQEPNKTFVPSLPDGSSSVASKRQQLAPHMSRIFGSMQAKSKALDNDKTLENSDNMKGPIEESANKDVRGDAKGCCSNSRESIEVTEGEGVEQMWLPTPDYTPMSTLGRMIQSKPSSSCSSTDQHICDGGGSSQSSDVKSLMILAAEECCRMCVVPTPDYDIHTPTPCPDCDCESYASSIVAADDCEKKQTDASNSSPKRTVRFDMKRQLSDVSATWSDVESVIFAEDRSFGSILFDGCTRAPQKCGVNRTASIGGGGATFPEFKGGRMDSYNDGLFWDQLAQMRKSKLPEDRERWEMEKTKRMLLWIHMSSSIDNKAQWCYRSHWWKAKQRASVMWIVQKANKNKVPAEYQDPYYRDHENREHLKPGIVSQLANADLYCSALANIYGDPNFFSLSHWKVIQALARKGVYVAEPTDVALNETILLQDSPIKMSAHLAVIEAMMALYIREVVVAERVVTALHKITGGTGSNEPTPQDQEEALVLWVARVTSALQDRIAQQLSENNQELPQFPRIQDLSDLSDGIGLAALISYYCPQELHWGDIAVADPPSMSDSLYNIGLVIKFCHEALPYNPCLLTKEDIVYMHSCVKQNVLAFVTELFFLLELQPVSCVTPHNRRASATKYASPSGMKPAGAPSVRRSHSMTLNDVAAGGGDGTGVPGDRSLLSSRSRGSAMMLDSRSPQQHHHHHHQDHHSSSHSDYGGRESSMSDGQDGEFVVQRSRGVSTLNDMIRHNRPSAHDQRDDDTQSWYDGSRHGGRRGMDDDTQSRLSNEDDVQSFKMYRRDSQYGSIQDLQQTEKLPPAGMPSRFENRPQGRSRSRRNSISAEESQLTVENFGGSQDNLNEYISRKSEKEAVVHSGRKDSLDRTNRASMHQQQLDNRILDKLQREALEREKREFMFGSKNAIFAEDPPSYEPPPPPPADANNQDSGSESDLSSEREKLSKATSFAELGKIKEQLPQGGINIIYMQGDKPDKKNQQLKMNEKKSNAVGNQTTWKQQAPQNSQADDGKRVGDENMEPQLMASELHNVRMKLEEKRRRIEAEKRKMEQVLNKQRQKMGKEAFMQAVVKGDIGAEMSQVSRRWLAEGDGVDGGEVRTPDVEAMDYEQYHTSLTQMTDSLSELQGDIQRLNAQQQQIQGMLRNGQQPPHQQQQQQFYLHDQSPGGGNSGGRRMWGDGGAMPAAGVAPDYSNSPVTRRAQWGPVRPVPGHVAPDFYQQQQGYYPPAPQPGYQQQLPPLHHPQQQGGGGGSFMLHGGQPHSMPAPPPHPHLQYSAQNGGGQYYPGQDHQSYKGPPPYSQQYQVPQDGRTPPNAAPFRLHSGDDDATNSSRGPSSLRSSVHNSPNRLPLQQQPPHYNTYSSPHQYPPNYSSPGQQYTPPSYGMQHHTPPPGHPNPAAAGPAPPQHHPHQSPAGRQSVSPARSIKHDGSNSIIHAPVAAPPPDDMEPQNVSFIDSSRNSQERESVQRTPNSRRSEVDSGADSPTTERLKRMSIGSGSRTYRIPKDDGSSPTRPTVGTKTFRVPTKRLSSTVDDRERSLSPSSYQTENGTNEHSPVPDHLKTEPLTSDGAKPDKGFYISFDDDAPIKPKPPLRTKKFTRKNSTPTTPVSTPSKEDFPLITDTPLRSTRTPSLDLPSPSSLYKRPSLFSPTSRASLSPSSPAAPLHPTNGFNYSSSANDSTAESSEDIQPAEVAGESSTGLALVIGSDLLHQPESQLSDMERKKQRLMINAMKRKQQQEELKRVKEMEAEQKREKEKEEEERKLKKKEDERQRRELILERHKIKKAIEEAEKEGRYYQPPAWYLVDQQQQQASSKSSSVKLRAKAGGGGSRPRPKTMHEGDSSDGSGGGRLMAARRNRGSTHNVAESGGGHSSGGPSSVRKSAGRWGSSHSLSRAAGSRGSTNSLSGDYSTTTTRTLDRRTNLHSGRRPSSMAPTSSSLSRHQSTKSLYGSRSRLADARDEDGPEHYRVHANPRRAGMGGGGGPEQHLVGGSTGLRRPSGGYRAPTAASNSRRYRSTGNLSGASEHDSLMYGMSEDSGLGRSTPPRRAASPGGSGGTAGGGAVGRHLPSPSQPGSLPPGLISRRRPNVHGFDDAASDISTTSSTMDFTGPRLYKQPASKSNRPIVLNAVEFCVFPGAVNESSKLRVMEEIARSGSKHFLFLFRDAGCQFRALYSFNIETEEVDKLYGTGPKRITEGMFDKFFKYNSGAKNFSQVHTKHITATIDAFTIHNSLWQGKKVSMHSKKDFALVI